MKPSVTTDKQGLEKAKGEFLVYQAKDGTLKLDVRLENETVWLTQAHLAQLFQVKSQNITMHLKNIYAEGELSETATCKDFLQVQTEGSRQVERKIKFYNLDAIISVGYRIKSQVATRFRIWATERLKEYIVKGFTMDDERLKEPQGGRYFEELLARIRDIRSSEKVFWRKILDIMPPALITMVVLKIPNFFSNRCKTRCTGQRTAIPQQN